MKNKSEKNLKLYFFNCEEIKKGTYKVREFFL